MNGRTASRAIQSRMPIRIAALISTATRGEIAANRGFDPVDERVDEGGRRQLVDPRRGGLRGGTRARRVSHGLSRARGRRSD